MIRKRSLLILVWLLALLVSAPVAALQFARPDGTNNAGTFTEVGAGTHHDAVNEVTASDSDYVDSGVGNDSTIIFSLSNVNDPGAYANNHIIRWRCQTTVGSKPRGGEICDVALFQGGTQIATTNNRTANRGAFATDTFTIVDASAITDYSALELRLTSSSLGNDESIQISWAELELPDAVGGNPPTLDSSTLLSLAAVTSSTATLGGNISADGGDPITSRGTVWNTTGGTITENTVAEGGTAIGGFSQLRSSLNTGTQIFFRSYAININGTSYGPDNSFYTEPSNSSASTTIDNVGDTSFRINWPANPAGSGDGALVVVSTNSITAAPTDGNSHAFNSVYGTGGTDIGTSEFVVFRGTGVTNVTVTGLTASTTYNVAVFYSAGTGNGETGINYRQATPATNSQNTNTPAVAPTVTVTTPVAITSDSALLGGEVTNNGGAAVTDRGIWWHTSSPPESGGTQVPIGSGDGPFSQTVSVSPAGTTIYVRAYATNSAGTSVSTVIESFDTLVGLPTVDTPTVADITSTTATLGGNVQNDGGGTITQRGTVWGTATDPDIVAQAANVNIVAGTTGTFTGPVIDLPTGTLVYYRAYATNSAGTAYSASGSFTPSEPPIMGAPTLGNLNYFSAELGGIITSDGGNPILSRGTVWNTTGSPVIETDNPLAEGGTAVSEAFSHTRFLTAGDDVFYRAYATSVVGTGYSTQGSLTVPTQPDVQATLVTFPRVAANSLRITWTRGNGEGSIVVMRAGTAPIGFDPTDGTEPVANSDFTAGEDLGSGHVVVYRGIYNSVVVTGLTESTTYSVAVYEYAGTGAGTDYLQLNPAEGTQSTNNVPVHNLDNNIDCDLCHAHSKSASYVPHDADVKLVCEFCHQTGQVAAAKLEFDNHLAPGKNPAVDFVDCGSCHELHNPNAIDTTESLHSIDLITRTNKSFLRANVTKYVPTAAEPAYLHTDQPLREDPHPDAPLAADNPDRAVEDGDDTTARGYCQVCHTLTNYHTNNPSTSLSDQCHDGDTGNCGPAETNCGNCHQHNNKFIGVGGTTTCIQCHDSEVGSTITRAIITTQFDRNSTHITGGSAAVTQPDCLVCHNQGGHQAGKINAWNADDGSTNYAQLTAFVPTTNTGEGEQYEGHCMSCHDDGVASSLPGTGDQTDTSPFIGSNAPPVIDQSAWNLAGHNRKQGGFVLASPPLDPAVPITAGTEVTCLGNGVNGCHGSAHGSEQNSLLAPVTGAAISPTDFCFNCHDGAPGQDIQLQFGNPVPDTSLQTTSNSGADVNQRHDIYIDDQLYSGGSVTCKDCHSPHSDSAANPVADPDTGLALNTYSPANSYTEDGNNFSYDAGGNQDPTNPEGGSGPVPESDYIQFCLTCHDGTTPVGVTMSASMVDIASVYGGKQHGGGEGSSGSKTGKGNLKVPWTTSGDFSAGNDPSNPYAAMNCTLCHGAHGSPSIFNLRESINVAGVDMTVGAIAGSGEFQVGTFADPDGDLKTYTLPINGGTQGDHQYGAWCTFCHDMNAHAGVDETTTCTSAHMHGSNSF